MRWVTGQFTFREDRPGYRPSLTPSLPPSGEVQWLEGPDCSYNMLPASLFWCIWGVTVAEAEEGGLLGTSQALVFGRPLCDICHILPMSQGGG